MNGVAKFNAVGPYVGVGFGTPATRGNALKFVFDLGAVIGQPTVSLSATGGAFAQGSVPYNDLQVQQMTTQQDLNKLKVYPVISFGLALLLLAFKPSRAAIDSGKIHCPLLNAARTSVPLDAMIAEALPSTEVSLATPPLRPARSTTVFLPGEY